LSGFGKNCKNILKYLCSTGKYEVVEFANAYKWSDPSLETLPWKCVGSGPDERSIIIENNNDTILSREMSYGLLKLDEIIKQEKPDIYIGAEDIWAFIKTTKKPWWNKITCMLWTTLDSLPLLPESIDIAKNTPHYFTWANFAKEELHRIGLKHVKCMHGAIETKSFYKIKKETKEQIRKANGIHKDDFIIGFVFRNQLRKSVPNLLDGFKLFKDSGSSKSSSAKLLLHTGWHEGWDINSLIKEKKINKEDILTTYYCENCKKYSIQPFSGDSKDCSMCGSNQSLKTISVKNGPTEKQLNEIYNIMDMYCHPFTSGGQEIPIQEAKLCELITASTNYSCGEDMNTEQAHGLALEWSEYREPGTQFIKASTRPESIFCQIKKVSEMSEKEKQEKGLKSRQFVINNYSTKIIGSQLEEIIDSVKPHSFNFNFSEKKINPDYTPPRISDNSGWIIDLYRNMFSIYLKKEDPSVQKWSNEIKNGKNKSEILNELRKIALAEIKHEDSETLFRKKIKRVPDKANRIGVVCQGGRYETFLSTAMLEELKNLYPDKKIFFITHDQNRPILDKNPHIEEFLPFFEGCDNQALMEGAGSEGFFHVCYILPKLQNAKNLHHNGNDKISEALKK